MSVFYVFIFMYFFYVKTFFTIKKYEITYLNISIICKKNISGIELLKLKKKPRDKYILKQLEFLQNKSINKI